MRYAEAPELLDTPKKWQKLIGMVFGRLTVLGYAGKNDERNRKLVTCRCSCGFYVDLLSATFRGGQTTSCGCRRSEVVAASNVARTKHGAAQGGTVTPLYRVWCSCKGRCLDPNNAAYKDYGGRREIQTGSPCEA